MTAYRTLTICGKPVPLTERQVKGKDHTWFAFGTNPRFGSPIPALGTSLPTVVQYEGQDFVLTLGETQDGRKKVTGAGSIVFAEGENGVNEHRNLTVSISETKDGWNLKAGVTRVGTSGGGRQAVDLDSLWASLV